MRRFREMAAQFGMAALVEVHDAAELDVALASGAEIIGVNNRNLQTFEVTLETSLRLAEKIPASVDQGQRKRHPFRGRREEIVTAPDTMRFWSASI